MSKLYDLLYKAFSKIKTNSDDISSLQETAEYRPGDVIQIANTEAGVMCAGVLSNARTEITFTIPLAKPLSSEITSVAVSDCRVNVRSGGSYLISGSFTSGGYQIAISNTWLSANGGVTLKYTHPTALAETNNTSFTVEINACTLTFS